MRLVLNVEQYEYMPGPHDAAGVKIFIHDQDEFPLVGDLGLAVPTGSHSFVGNSLFVVSHSCVLSLPLGPIILSFLCYITESYAGARLRYTSVTSLVTTPYLTRRFPNVPKISSLSQDS